LAKRLDIALEKQLEAFSILEVKMNSITKIASDIRNSEYDFIDEDSLKRLKAIHNEFLKRYDLLRIYLPPQLELAIDDFNVSVFASLDEDITVDEQRYAVGIILRRHRDIVSSIRKYIGIEHGKQ
jgi:hypothetical protein